MTTFHICYSFSVAAPRFGPNMALYSGSVLALLYGCSYLCVGYCAMLKTDDFPARRKVDFTHSVDKRQPTKEAQELLLQDTMTEHMQMLYAKYNRAGFPFKDGNTVRSFKAHWGTYPKFNTDLYQSRKGNTVVLILL